VNLYYGARDPETGLVHNAFERWTYINYGNGDVRDGPGGEETACGREVTHTWPSNYPGLGPVTCIVCACA